MNKEKQIDIIEELHIEDLLIDFDEMGFIPTTPVPDPDAYAVEWKNKLIEALKGYRKASDVAREIFEELDKRLDEVTVVASFNDCFITTFRKTMEKVTAKIEELKKKYTESEKDNG